MFGGDFQAQTLALEAISKQIEESRKRFFNATSSVGNLREK
jgi:hypothetical protein